MLTYLVPVIVTVGIVSLAAVVTGLAVDVTRELRERLAERRRQGQQ
jgi:hypothetical protein